MDYISKFQYRNILIRNFIIEINYHFTINCKLCLKKAKKNKNKK